MFFTFVQPIEAIADCQDSQSTPGTLEDIWLAPAASHKVLSHSPSGSHWWSTDSGKWGPPSRAFWGCFGAEVQWMPELPASGFQQRVEYLLGHEDHHRHQPPPPPLWDPQIFVSAYWRNSNTPLHKSQNPYSLLSKPRGYFFALNQGNIEVDDADTRVARILIIKPWRIHSSNGHHCFRRDARYWAVSVSFPPDATGLSGLLSSSVLWLALCLAPRPSRVSQLRVSTRLLEPQVLPLQAEPIGQFTVNHKF